MILRQIYFWPKIDKTQGYSLVNFSDFAQVFRSYFSMKMRYIDPEHYANVIGRLSRSF